MLKFPLLASYIFFLVVLVSCSNDSGYTPTTNTKEKNNTISNVNSDTLDQEIIEIKDELITNINAEEMLTQYGKENPETKVLMKTSKGNIKIKLYNQTPLHRANFIMLAKKKYFDSTKFYRVIKNFMIQGGNTDDDKVTTKMASIGSYRIPNEINQSFAHVRGAIAMAVSPEEQQFEKKSSAYNFYIVEGQKLNEDYLKEIEKRGIHITPQNRDKYLEVGGAPHLDGQYTVFGDVYEGLSVVKNISQAKTNEGDWPVNPIYILSVEIIE